MHRPHSAGPPRSRPLNTSGYTAPRASIGTTNPHIPSPSSRQRPKPNFHHRQVGRPHTATSSSRDRDRNKYAYAQGGSGSGGVNTYRIPNATADSSSSSSKRNPFQFIRNTFSGYVMTTRSNKVRPSSSSGVNYQSNPNSDDKHTHTHTPKRSTDSTHDTDNTTEKQHRTNLQNLYNSKRSDSSNKVRPSSSNPTSASASQRIPSPTPMHAHMQTHTGIPSSSNHGRSAASYSHGGPQSHSPSQSQARPVSAGVIRPPSNSHSQTVKNYTYLHSDPLAFHNNSNNGNNVNVKTAPANVSHTTVNYGNVNVNGNSNNIHNPNSTNGVGKQKVSSHVPTPSSTTPSSQQINSKSNSNARSSNSARPQSAGAVNVNVSQQRYRGYQMLRPSLSGQGQEQEQHTVNMNSTGTANNNSNSNSPMNTQRQQRQQQRQQQSNSNSMITNSQVTQTELTALINIMSTGNLTSYSTTQFYTIGKVVGVGSFAKVRIGWHKLTGGCVAVKTYDKGKIAEKSNRSRSNSGNNNGNNNNGNSGNNVSTIMTRIKMEIKIMEKLNHPRLIRLFEVLESPKRIHLIMEYVNSGNLCTYVKSKKRLSESEAKGLFLGILDGVCYLHSMGIVHRDIKLENILLTPAGTIKLIDFGFSCFTTDASALKVFCGTPSYMSPEIVKRTTSVYDGRMSDCWSVGVVLYALVNGCFPFSSKSYPELYKKIVEGKYRMADSFSTPLKGLITGLLEGDATNRSDVNKARRHPWIIGQAGINTTNTVTVPSEYLTDPTSSEILISKNPKLDLHETIITEMAKFGVRRDVLLGSVLGCKHDGVSACYYLLKQRMKDSGVPFDFGVISTATSSGNVSAIASSGVNSYGAGAANGSGSGSGERERERAVKTVESSVSRGGGNVRPLSAPATKTKTTKQQQQQQGNESYSVNVNNNTGVVRNEVNDDDDDDDDDSFIQDDDDSSKGVISIGKASGSGGISGRPLSAPGASLKHSRNVDDIQGLVQVQGGDSRGKGKNVDDEEEDVITPLPVTLSGGNVNASANAKLMLKRGQLGYTNAFVADNVEGATG